MLENIHNQHFIICELFYDRARPVSAQGPGLVLVTQSTYFTLLYPVDHCLLTALTSFCFFILFTYVWYLLTMKELE
jgi:hypothetical protein